MTTINDKIDLIGIGREELCRLVSGFGMKPFRGKQIFKWLHKNGEISFDRMTDLSKGDREILHQRARISLPVLADKLCASDGTEKYLYHLTDGQIIEGVLIPDEKRLTLCVSTQVGCAMGCTFCLTGQGGLVRNLTASEIVGQVLPAGKMLQEHRPLTHIVLMGMGEPLANYENTIQAVRILLDPMGTDFSRRKITLSTCGLIPGIQRLAKENIGINLAVSLNASESSSRDRIMPINRTYPLEKLLNVLQDYPLSLRSRITFEYVLIQGINDSPEDAGRLTRILRGIRCKINLIPYNPIQGMSFAPPPRIHVQSFQDILLKNRYTVMIRESRGQEISAACGQLRGSTVF